LNVNDHLRSDPSVPALPPVSFDQKGRGLVAPVKLVAVPSPDGGALSVLFEGLTADTQRVHDEGAVATRFASFNWPLINPGQSRDFTADLRWFAGGTAATRACIAVTIFGVTTSLSVPQNDTDQPAGPFEPISFSGTIPESAEFFTGTVLVTAERLFGKREDHALLTVESLDIALVLNEA
jgi:hypothetical protein